MEPACITNMDIVSLEMVAKKHTTNKVVAVLLGARGKDFPTKDTLKSVKNIIQIEDANLANLAYQHSKESIKASDNDLEKKVELIEMGNKIIKLESEIKDIKRSKNIMITSSKSDHTVKKYEEIKDKK